MKFSNFITKIHTSIGKTTIIQISNNKTMTYRDKEFGLKHKCTLTVRSTNCPIKHVCKSPDFIDHERLISTYIGSIIVRDDIRPATIFLY